MLYSPQYICGTEEAVMKKTEYEFDYRKPREHRFFPGRDAERDDVDGGRGLTIAIIASTVVIATIVIILSL